MLPRVTKLKSIRVMFATPTPAQRISAQQAGGRSLMGSLRKEVTPRKPAKSSTVKSPLVVIDAQNTPFKSPVSMLATREHEVVVEHQANEFSLPVIPDKIWVEGVTSEIQKMYDAADKHGLLSLNANQKEDAEDEILLNQLLKMLQLHSELEESQNELEEAEFYAEHASMLSLEAIGNTILSFDETEFLTHS